MTFIINKYYIQYMLNNNKMKKNFIFLIIIKNKLINYFALFF